MGAAKIFQGGRGEIKNIQRKKRGTGLVISICHIWSHPERAGKET